MKNKIIVILAILALCFSLAACGSSTPAPAPAPTPAPAPAPAAEGEAAYEYDEVFVTNVTPKLQALVDKGEMTPERMQDIIARIKTGEYQKPYVQKILAGEEK